MNAGNAARHRIRTPRRRTTIAAGAVLGTAALALGGLNASSAPASGEEDRALRFSHPTTIDNRYLPITKFGRCELRGTDNAGVQERSIKTRQPGTKTFEVRGRTVETVIIRDNAYEDGELVESTLDYYAQADDGTVYYFGEQVKNIENGEVVNTNGTWLYGTDTDRLGVAMPAEPEVGDQWHFEDVPGLTTESNRVEETDLRTKVGDKVMTDVIRVQEFIQPEGSVEYKLYAAGIGTVAEYPPDARVFNAGCR